MATHTVASDEQVEKKETEEVIGETTVSLSNENEDKHEKAEDAQGAVPSLSKVAEEEEEREDDKTEPAVVEVENLKEVIADAATIQPEEPPPTRPAVTETGEEKQLMEVDIPEASAETIKKSSNPVELNTLVESEAEIVKVTENFETSSQKVESSEPVVTREEQQKVVVIPEPKPSADPIEEKTREVEFDTEVVKETSNNETEEPESAVTKVEGHPSEPELEPEPKPSVDPIEEKTRELEFDAEIVKETSNYETEEPESAVTKVEDHPSKPEPEPPTEPKPSIDPIEEKTRELEFDAAVVKETSNYETEEPESAVTKPSVDLIEEKTRELEFDAVVVKETSNYETEEPESAVIKVEDHPSKPEPEPSAETEPEPEPKPSADPIEEKTRELESDAEVVKETSNYETEEPESAVTKVEDHPSKPEPEPSAETESEPEPKPSADPIQEKTRELESDAEVVKETSSYETEEPESAVTKVEDHPREPEEKSLEKVQEEQPGTVINETAAESTEKAGDILEVHPPKESDIEVSKETDNSEPVPVEEEKPEFVSPQVEEEKPKEQPVVDEEVKEESKAAETKQELVGETAKSEGNSDDTIEDPISLKEEKTDKEEEISVTESSAQVSLNEEAQAAPENAVEPSPVIAEEGKKDSISTDGVERVQKEVTGVVENPEHVSVNQEAKTDLKEEKEDSGPSSVEEKVAVNDDNKVLSPPVAVEESPREAEVEIKNVEEEKEAKATTTEEEGVKVESVKDDQHVVDNEKEEQAVNKVDEEAKAASEAVRETLASKFEEKEGDSIKTDVDDLKKEQVEESVETEVPNPEPATKDLPKETGAKAPQKQSNNIISKVKQSLVKAKKALTGKSPSSKNLSSETKGDIKVK